MKIKIPIKKEVVKQEIEVEVPCYRKVEFDEDQGGESGVTCLQFFKIISLHVYIKICKTQTYDEGFYTSVEVHEGGLYGIPERALTNESYSTNSNEQEFVEELTAALAQLGVAAKSNVAPDYR